MLRLRLAVLERDVKWMLGIEGFREAIIAEDALENEGFFSICL